MDYRREVDGLRALAVVPVMLFHAGFERFGGGFVGVDVFFVISGYLITSVIVGELERGRFSIARFYERRARRILPALFLVMFFSIPLSWLWLPAGGMKDFAQSLVAVPVFASNVLLWRESGYFDTAAELKPLLHTWSLSVEEQYYILFPVFLMAFWRAGRRRLAILLAAASGASFGLAHWASTAMPAAAFFLLPTRAWELAIGAFAALHLSDGNRVRFGRMAGEFGGWLGLGLVAFSILAYTKATPFPGAHALLPTVGAFLVIVFATGETAVGRLLASRACVGIGLLSYSLYLWHQPLFVFVKHWRPTPPGDPVFLAVIAATFVLAYVTWRYVETPFRAPGRISRGRVLSLGVSAGLFFIAVGGIGHVHDGFPKQFGVADVPVDRRTTEDFIVVGDSHGGHLIGGLRSVTSGSVVDYTSGGCIPLRNVDRYDYRFAPGECVRKVNGHLDRILADDPRAVVLLSSMGPVYLDGTPFNGKDLARVTGLGVELVTDRSLTDRWRVFEIGLRTTLGELSRLRNASVVFAIDVPELGIDFGCDTHKKSLDLGGITIGDLLPDSAVDRCFVSRKAYDERTRAYKALVRQIAAEFPAVRVFDPTEAFCDEDRCKGFDPRLGFLYRDVDHLSAAGSRLYATRLVEFLRAKDGPFLRAKASGPVPIGDEMAPITPGDPGG